MARFTLLLALSLLGMIVSAASESPLPTISVFNGGTEPLDDTNVGIVGINEGRTTVEECLKYYDESSASTSSASTCDPTKLHTMVFGTDMFSWHHESTRLSALITQSLSCSLNTKAATCYGTAMYSLLGSKATSTTVMTFTGSDYKFTPMTVTSGADKLSAGATATATATTNMDATATDGSSPAATTTEAETGGVSRLMAMPNWVTGCCAAVGLALAI